jgi:hypothetical protein
MQRDALTEIDGPVIERLPITVDVVFCLSVLSSLTTSHGGFISFLTKTHRLKSR